MAASELAHGYTGTVDELVGRFDRVIMLADDGWRRKHLERVAACCQPEIHVDRKPLAAAFGALAGDDALLDRLRRSWSLANRRGYLSGDRRFHSDHYTESES